MVRVIEELASDWRRLDERIKGLSGEIEELAKRDAGCERACPASDRSSSRHGRRDRNRRGVLQGSRLRRLAGTRAQAGLDRSRDIYRPGDVGKNQLGNVNP